MEPFTLHTGRAIPLPLTGVDTDQIIPARFCTSPSRTGYAEALFADWREDPAFVFNQSCRHGATILISGGNFGSGSSREAAVWALQDFGFRVVIASSFGEIFRANALMAGLLAVGLPGSAVESLLILADSDPGLEITVDLRGQLVQAAGLVESFAVDADTRTRLLDGLDPISATLRHAAEISRYERERRGARPCTLPVRGVRG